MKDNNLENSRAEILIVEDSPTQAEELKYVLERHNYGVSVASNGIEALSLIKLHKPTIVISDIVMPEMDGYQLCREIKQDDRLKNLPVILLTSLSNPRDVIKGLECGADNFLTKPYEEKYILSRIQYIIANKNLKDNEQTQLGVEIILDNERYFIKSDRIQILNLLLSSYEAAIQKNGELIRAQKELKSLNEHLEQTVESRTAALQESEGRYRILLESVTDYIYTTLVENGKQVATSYGAGCVAVTGYTSEEYAADPGLWLSMVYGEDRAIVMEQANSVLAGKTPVTIEHRIIHKDGRICWIRNTPVPRHNQEGSLIACDGIVTDITEQKTLEEQLRHSQKMEAIGTLAGGVAHDFNNILQAILGYSDLILNKAKDNDPVKHYVEEIMEASKRAAVLTNNLLSFSRKQTVSLAVIDLSEVIKSNEAFLRRLISEDIELKITCTGDPLAVLADRGQIEQVIMNLVTNARDAMPNGGKLSIETQPVTMDQEFIETHGYGKAGEYVMFSVSDSGVGMDKETLLRIFEPFFTTKEQGHGTGLGLSMAYGIVKKHDGFINVYSEPGTGTIFRIYLPREQAGSLAGKIETSEVAPLRGGTETILVGEDDADLLRLSTRILSHYGYRVIEAVDGQDAVDKFIEYGESIDLVLLDAIMPKKNGREAFQEMRMLCPDLKTVFVSGYTRDIFADGNQLDENSVFIQKPISTDELVATVRAMLDK